MWGKPTACVISPDPISDLLLMLRWNLTNMFFTSVCPTGGLEGARVCPSIMVPVK